MRRGGIGVEGIGQNPAHLHELVAHQCLEDGKPHAPELRAFVVIQPVPDQLARQYAAHPHIGVLGQQQIGLVGRIGVFGDRAAHGNVRVFGQIIEEFGRSSGIGA